MVEWQTQRTYQLRQNRIRAKVSAIVGDSCWICGYNRCTTSIGFHHVDPKNKLFGLTTRELMLKWSKVFAEMKKCIRICANCHGEIHDGVINQAVVHKVWKKGWS